MKASKHGRRGLGPDRGPATLAGFRSNFLPDDYLRTAFREAFRGRLGEADADNAQARFRRWWKGVSASFGPSSSVRAITDRAAVPLIALLGFQDARRVSEASGFQAMLLPTSDRTLVVLMVGGWNRPLDGLWGEAVRQAIEVGAGWTLCFNGCQLRAVDARRTWARRFIEFDLETTTAADEFVLLWSLVRADAFVENPVSLLDEVVVAAERHTLSVCGSLEAGVRSALIEICGGLIDNTSRRRTPSVSTALAFEQSLTIVYRVLFLLFAEARRLVPVWHPIYRDSYTIEALRRTAEDGLGCRGIWETLQAIGRLAHRGCEAGDLRVTPFNGRLFAPARTPLGESACLSDRGAARAVLALTTRPAGTSGGRYPIAYRDLGVEQLGAVYERVLDFEPQPTGGGPVALVATGRRKATGSFYTPRSVTDFLVRRTLHPLVDGASTDAILSLRILDPAMGSGAFLVSACRYLATAYEAAALREGSDEVTEADRAGFRRSVAQRCLYGVDVNPMAVQLARLSLWLTTLAADRPLSFLDHRIRVGDSLVGASLDDLSRQPPGGPVRRTLGSRTLPLFEPDEPVRALRQALPLRHSMANIADDSVDAVRQKEETLDRLASSDSPLARWQRAADIWCACWFWNEIPRPSRAVMSAMTDAALGKPASLPASILEQWVNRADAIAASRRFFHWSLEFPEIFFEDDGAPRPGGGFDAVLGNPPWDVVRADHGDAATREQERAEGSQLVRFARSAGVYQFQETGHPNRYQLFVDRAMRLLRRGGRFGMVLPSGLATDRGSAALRRHLLTRCETDTVIGFENRLGIFPIHRSVKFLLVNATVRNHTSWLRCRFGERDPAVLDSLPDADATFFPADSEDPTHLRRHGRDERRGVAMTPALLARISGPDLTIPDLRTNSDLALVERLFSFAPAMGSPSGWNAHFGRELNATDDRPHFVDAARAGRRTTQLLSIVEGKQIDRFVCRSEAARFAIRRDTASALLGGRTPFNAARLAYREVASSTNRLTLIAAVVPPGHVTTHTLVCLKNQLDEMSQWFLCGLLNSFIANYLVRIQVSTHVGVRTVEHLPVVRPERSDPLFQEIATLARDLLSSRGGHPLALARIQGCVALLYDLSITEFEQVLATFPLVSMEERAAAAAELAALLHTKAGGGHGRPVLLPARS